MADRPWVAIAAAAGIGRQAAREPECKITAPPYRLSRPRTTPKGGEEPGGRPIQAQSPLRSSSRAFK